MMKVTINDFEGPLDLLLHLIKSAKMDIYEIDINKVIESYLEFINSLEKFDLNNASEYLVMAAELIHLKSRLLINDKEINDDEYEINSEDDLKKKLIEYEKYKNVCHKMRNFEENRKDYLTKDPENLTEFLEEKKLSKEISLDDLIMAFLELQKREEYNRPINTKITKKELSVEDKTKYIKNILKARKKLIFFDLFENNTKEELIVTFLSILNLSKEKEIKIYQENNFENIFIEGIF